MTMTIDSHACEWLKLNIVTEPATGPTDWEATFDQEGTWITAQDIDGNSAWLIAGPDYAGASTPDFTTNLASTRVKVRLVDNPETVIRVATRIETKEL